MEINTTEVIILSTLTFSFSSSVVAILLKELKKEDNDGYDIAAICLLTIPFMLISLLSISALVSSFLKVLNDIS